MVTIQNDMTNEEAINHIENMANALQIFPDSKQGQALLRAIKALEQEPILDKIRAEIEQVKSIMNEEIINHDRKDLINFVNGLNQSLVIIDKYKAESEDKE